MRMKKFISLALALVMALALAVPAMAKNDKKGGKAQPSVPAVAVDKIEDTDQNGDPDPRLPLIEAGAEISIAKYSAIYIKQANDVAIIVQAGDTRSDEDIIAEARASDKSLAKEGKGTVDVLRGAGSAILHGNTTVTVANGVLTVLGTISHASFVGGDAPTIDELQPGDGKVSAEFQIFKYLNEVGTPGEGFTFEIIGSEGVVDTMTSDKYGEAKATIDVKPGIYTIHEVMTELDLITYEAVADLTVTVNEYGEVIFDGDENYIINYELGALDATVDSVVQQYIKQTHELDYKLYEMGTLVSDANNANSLTCVIGTNKGNSGMPWLTINKAALAAEPNGVTIGIATSDPNNTPAPAMKDTGKQPTFNLRIDGDQLVVTSELPNIGVRLYSVSETPSGKPNDLKGPYATDSHLTGQTSTTLPLPAGDSFMFFLHIADTKYYTTEVIGCHVASTETKEQAFSCTPVMTVENDAGEVVYTGEIKKVESLKRGEYTVTITVNETNSWSETVEVKAGETTTVDFGKLTVSEMGETVVICTYTNCPGYVAPVEP